MQNQHYQAQVSGFTHTSPCLAAVFDLKPPLHLAMLKITSGYTGYRKVNIKLSMKEGQNVKLWLLQSIPAAKFVQGHWSTSKCFAAARWVFWWGAWGQARWAVSRLQGPSWEWSWSLLHAMHLHLCQVYCWKREAICHCNAPLPILRCPPLLQTRWLLTKLGNCGLWSLELPFFFFWRNLVLMLLGP